MAKNPGGIEPKSRDLDVHVLGSEVRASHELRLHLPRLLLPPLDELADPNLILRHTDKRQIRHNPLLRRNTY